MKYINLLLISCSLMLSSSALFAAGAAETNRVPQFETEEVKVWKTTIYPKQPLKMHRHDHKRILVALTDIALTVKNDKGVSYLLEMKKDTSRMLPADHPGELHNDVNESEHPMELMVIEFKNIEFKSKDKKESLNSDE